MSEPDQMPFMISVADEFRAQGKRILNDDCLFLVRGAQWPDRGINFAFEVEPGPALKKDSKGNEWDIPDRLVLMQLLARTYNVRTRRANRATWTIPELPASWRDAVYAHFPIYRGSSLSVDSGWGDLLLATADWLSEVEPELPAFDQVKEKYGGLRLYYGHGGGLGETIVDCAEYLSEFICEVCGAPGENRVVGGWHRTTCETHRSQRV